MQNFDHEKLDVYQVSIEFVILVEQISQALPRGKAYLADQLRRAASSIVLNITEGAGEFSLHEKARFYRIAKRSATESAGVLAILLALELDSKGIVPSGRHLLLRIVSMLTKMIKLAGK